MKLAIQIAAGIVIAFVVIGIGTRLYVQAELQAASDEMEKLQTDITHRAAETRARIRADQQEQQRQAQETVRRQTAAAQFARDASNHKSVAWTQFFKPRKECDSPKDWATQVECGNSYIRAKREFEARWANGEFQ